MPKKILRRTHRGPAAGRGQATELIRVAIRQDGSGAPSQYGISGSGQDRLGCVRPEASYQHKTQLYR